MGSRSRSSARPKLNYLRWSPDGSELLFWARGAGRNGIYVVPQLGGRPRLIAMGMVFLSCWSPDGSTIAAAGALDNKIRFFDARGREQRALTLEGDHWSIWDLDWSAAGDRLLFVSSDRQGRYEIGTIGADGIGQQKILSSADRDSVDALGAGRPTPSITCCGSIRRCRCSGFRRTRPP